MLLSANSSSLSGQRPLPCGRRSAAGLPPLRQHTAASSAVAKSSSVFYDSCAAAPRARSAGIPGGGPDVGRGLGHGPFAPAQASFVLPSPAKGYSSSRFSGHGYRGVSAAPVPPRSSSGAQLPITHPRGKPQPQPNEDDQLQAAADDAEQQCINKAAGSSAGAPAEGDAAAPVPASTPNASAVAAAQLLRGALEAVLVPRLEAMEGSIVEAVEGTIAEMMLEQEQRLVAAAETQGQRTKEEVKTMVEAEVAALLPKVAVLLRQEAEATRASSPPQQQLGAQEERFRENAMAEVAALLSGITQQLKVEVHVTTQPQGKQSDKARPGSGASEKAELMPPAPQQESKWPRWVAAVAGALGGACAVLAIGFLFNFGAYLWKLALRAVVAKFSLPLPLPWGV